MLVAPFLDPCRRFERPRRENSDQGGESEDDQKQGNKGLSGLFS
jgi:hypothetical protein